MVPVSSYASMEAELAKRENDKSSFPITVGIILANPHTQFCKDHILEYLPEYNRRVGKLLNFYMPGYYLDSDCQTPAFCLDQKQYRFEPFDFFQAREILEGKGLSLTESPQLILTEYHRHKLRFIKKKTIIIDLEKACQSGTSVSEIFSCLISISKKEVEYSAFRAKYRHQKHGASFIHFLKTEAKSFGFTSAISVALSVFGL